MQTGPQIAALAKKQLCELTGLKADTVSSLSKDEGGWHVNIEVLELARIPNGNDVLGSYNVLLDDRGGLVSYKRVRRYRRGDLSENE